MKRAALVAAIVLAATLTLGVSAGRAADECKGLMTCIPVAGPWVVIPASSAASVVAEWRLLCPEGVVGGVDARASEKAVAVEFPGMIGSPVNPGITTRESLVFSGAYTGAARKATSYRPFIGCIPGSGGGQRTPTASTAAVKPGEPVTTRVKALSVVAGTLARTTLACKKGERLLGSSHSVGLFTTDVPTAAQLDAVRVIRVVRDGKILVSATRQGLPVGVRVQVQVRAECAA